MLLWLQLSYVLVGMAMNLMSLRHHNRTGRYYTPTRPVVGLAMIVFVLVLAVGGVLKHLVTGNTGQYASLITRWSAVIINAYGVVLCLFAVTLSFLNASGIY